MKLPKLVGCKIANSHRWARHRAEGETYWECRICGKRYFGEEPPEFDPASSIPGG